MPTNPGANTTGAMSAPGINVPFWCESVAEASPREVQFALQMKEQHMGAWTR